MKSRWSHLLRKRLNGHSTWPVRLRATSAFSRNALGGMSEKLTVPCDTRPPSVAPRKIMGPSGPTGRPAPTQQAQEMNLMSDVFHSNICAVNAGVSAPATPRGEGVHNEPPPRRGRAAPWAGCNR